MGASSSGSGGGPDRSNIGNQVPPSLRGSSVEKKVKEKATKSLSNFESRNLSIYKSKKYPNPTLKGVSKILEPGYKRDLNFFTQKVLTSKRAKKNIGYTQAEFANLTPVEQDRVAKEFRTKRNQGLTDAYGNPAMNQRDDSNQAPIIKEKNVGGRVIKLPVEPSDPNDPELLKSEEEEYDPRKTKRRGRRRTILTPSGVAGDLVLGKPTLLGA